jgi:hypothetical protein
VFALDLQYKDVRLALELASDVGAALPVSAVVQQLRGAVRAKGRGRWDSSAIVTVFEELDGAELRATGSGVQAPESAVEAQRAGVQAPESDVPGAGA